MVERPNKDNTLYTQGQDGIATLYNFLGCTKNVIFKFYFYLVKRIDMNRAISVISSVIFLNASCLFGFDDRQMQFEILQNDLESSVHSNKFENKEIGSQLIKTNIVYMGCDIQKKINRFEKRLEKYKENLQESQNEVEVQHWLKKIEKTEKKIRTLTEVGFGMEMLKARI